MIAGHRRKRACKLLGIKELPCIIKNISLDEATILMVNSNKQREHILMSEKAFSYKMKLEAMKRQGERTDLTCDQLGNKLSGKKSIQVLAEEIGESKSNVHRYIRLTELIPELLKLVDEEEIAFNPAVELSYLTKEEQESLFDIIAYTDATPSHAQAIQFKKLSEEGNLTVEKMEEIMSEEKPNQKEKYKINVSRFQKLLPKSVTSEKDFEDFVYNCVEEHYKREKQKTISR